MAGVHSWTRHGDSIDTYIIAETNELTAGCRVMSVSADCSLGVQTACHAVQAT